MGWLDDTPYGCSIAKEAKDGDIADWCDHSMIAERDLWITAKMMIDRHGGEASVEARIRADQLLQAGDAVGHAVWMRIVAAIPALEVGLAGGDRMN